MWDLRSRSRGVFVLISVLSGCALFYNAWGPILALTVSIILVIYVCYSLLTNDSILSPQTLFFVEYLNEGSKDIANNLNSASFYLSSNIRKLYIILYNHYRTYVASKMSRFHQNAYQLSNDTRQISRTSSRADLTTNQLSPIQKNEYQENTPCTNHTVARHLNDYSTTKITSTPLVPWRKDSNITSNGGIGFFTPPRPLRQETQSMYGRNHSSTRVNETVFSPEGSPWGTSISPKIRSKAAGIKTVQTVAGPLLASTRYNIDPKVYSDVTSPGLSTRLSKYATEANSKLTHQSQYSTGQFPKVNLSASPVPLINAKNVKARTPVTVRIAPPEANRYSPPERQKLISDVCRAENRTSPSVVQVLRDISLKRHASREDVSSDLAKKQRTEDLFDDKLDDLEEMTQKRVREDSPNTEEDALAKNNQLRPVKKSKTPSCFDVLNSLSSSNQYSSGIKRKASTLDLSRSGTPDIDKHFKVSDMVQTTPKILINVTPSQTEVRKPQKDDLNLKLSPNVDVELSNKLQNQSPTRVKGILKGVTSTDKILDQSPNQLVKRHTEIEKQNKVEITKNSKSVTEKPTNFTDKLFMKAEPETNERLRTLIQEQGNIKAKFTTDDTDEIKKEDIVNMRQTSMRARLQSMFDAISGKTAKKINPDVIIQADGTGEPATPSSLATLNSTTSTTNINTSSIVTSNEAPTVTASKLNTTTSTKHVTFNLPSTQSSLNSNSSSTNVTSSTGFVLSTNETGVKSETPKLSFGTIVTTTAPLSAPSTTTSTILGSSNAQNINPTSVAASIVDNSKTGPPSFTVATSPTQNLIPSTQNPSLNVSSGFNLNTITTTVEKSSSLSAVTFTSSSKAQDTNATSSLKPVPTFGTPNIPSSTSASENLNSELKKSNENIKTDTQTSVAMPNFSFGASKLSSPLTFGGNTQPVSSTPPTTSVNAPPLSSAVPSSTTQMQQSTFNLTSTTGRITAPATTAMFSFGNNTTAQTTSTGTLPFTNNINTSKSQASTFGNLTTQSTTTPAFGSAITATHNPPSFGSANSFQNIQSPASVAATTAQNAPTFSSNPPVFGNAVTTTAQNTSTFQAVTSSGPQPLFGMNTSTTSPSFAFGNTTAQTMSVPAFGTTVNSTASSTIASSITSPTFSFGSASTPSTKSGFSFGANVATTTPSSGGIATGSSNLIPAFGSAGGNAVPVFGTPATTAPPAFGATSSTAAPAFGGTSTTTAPVFGQTSSTKSSVFGLPAMTTASGMFNSTANQPTFGNASNSAAPSGFGTSKTTAPPAFGSQTSESGFNFSGTGIGKNNLFGNTNLNTNQNTAGASVPTLTTSSSAFGGNTDSKSLFSQTKSPPSFAASTSATFGNNATPSFGTPNASFGAVDNSITSGNTSGFGTMNSTTPAFGTQNSASKQTTPAPPPAFGSTNSAFGATAANSSGFSSLAAGFGTQNASAPNVGAGTTNTAAAFGTNVATLFGSQNQNPAPAFGAQNSTTPSFGATNNNTNTGFGFNGNQSQIQQNPSFSFTGNSAANNNAAATSPFQFGGAAAKTDGFNFNAPTTTPNINFGSTASTSFGAPTQGSNMFGAAAPAVPASGMFSIGAGSTTPRPRSNRPRRQR